MGMFLVDTPRGATCLLNPEPLSSTWKPDYLIVRSHIPPRIISMLEKGPVEVVGPKDSGKSFLTSWALANVEYIRCPCGAGNTTYRALYHLIRSAGELIPPSGYPKRYLLDLLARTKAAESAFLFLDDIHLMRDPEDLLETLRSIFPEERFVITSRTPLGVGQVLELEPYTKAEVATILTQRMVALREGSWDPEFLDALSSLIAEGKLSISKAFEVIKVAASTNSHLSVDVLESSLGEVLLHDAEIKVGTLPLHHRLVLLAIVSILSEGGVAYTGNIYDTYVALASLSPIKPLTRRRVSWIIRELSSLELIEVEMSYGGARGNTKVVTSLAVPAEDMLNLLLPRMPAALRAFLKSGQ